MRVKLQALATVVFLIGVLLGFACKLWFPQYWFDAYPFILLFYWLMEMVLSFLIDRKGVVENPVADAMQGKHFMKVLMISKMVDTILMMRKPTMNMMINMITPSMTGLLLLLL